MKFKIFLVALCIIPLLLTGQNTAIKAGHIINPKTNEVLDHKVILLKKNQIIGIYDNLRDLEYDHLIDLSDSWVSPGLFDCHVHITENLKYRNADFLAGPLRESNAFRVLRGVQNAKILLEGGFTTIKEIGNDGDYVTADLIKAIRRGMVEGPNIQYAGKIIAPYGGQSSGLTPAKEFYWHYEYLDADSHDEIRKAIRKNIYYGANTIKLVTDNMSYHYSAEDIAFAVAEAKTSNLKVSVHVLGGQAANEVIEGGAHSIEHGPFLNEKQLTQMKEKGIFLVGTDFHFNNWYAYGLDSALCQRLYQTNINRLKLAHQIGVKMAFGTDIIIDIEGKNRLESNLEILKTWKAAEIPAMDVMRYMTSDAAELLGMKSRRGSIESKFIADLVAFKKNPISDIENIHSTHFVMKNGKVIRND